MAGYKVVDIEEGWPSAAEALAVVEQEVRNGRQRRYVAVKLIHGYGSSGRGGRIRAAVRQYVQRQQAAGKIQGWIPGEDFSIFHSSTLQLLARCPQVRKDSDLERGNRGVTFIIL
ncbi:MAG: hypothetical protein ACOX7F_02345 [Eubacteriales bacterium]|jgi:hypothetical protein